MAKFNQKNLPTPPVASPIASANTVPDTVTAEGGHGFTRDTRSELFLLAVANMVGENTFYEKAGARDERFEQLVRTVAVDDPGWMLEFVTWLRGDANMRSASLVAAAEAVKARLDAKVVDEHPLQVVDGLDPARPGTGVNRALIDAVLQRADEPGEMLAYWTSRYGKRIPMPVKRGIADAASRLYNERSLIKYDTPGKAVRFGDVIALCHVAGDWRDRNHLYRYALERRHNRPDMPHHTLRTVYLHRELMALPVDERRGLLDGPTRRWEILAQAGFTWENLSGWLQGPMDATAWEAVIPSMGVMALARNLRNFDEAGVSDTVAEQVCAKFRDPDQVAASRMFPFRWLAAYRHAPSLRWAAALERALTLSLANVPALPGTTLILVDVSGSMADSAGGKNSDMSRADVAKVFAAALAVRAHAPTLAWFNQNSGEVRVPRASAVLKLVDTLPGAGGGTQTANAVRSHYRQHDRVVVITDEQNRADRPDQLVPADCGFYTWNLAGYQAGHTPSGRAGTRHTFGGLTDAAFQVIPLLEAGRAGGWPWESGR